MRVARLLGDAGETYGLVKDGRVAAAGDMARQTGIPLPPSVKSFLFDGWAGEVAGARVEYGRDLGEFELLAPIAAPPKIMCLIFNYADHAAELGAESPGDPVMVIKPRTALTGPHSAIRLPPFVEQLDYEVELALVIGRDCRGVPEERAMECVAGYMILNDVTAREIQFGDGQYGRAKGMDTFAPCGPWITTADEIPDPQRLGLKTRVNGRIRQDSSTANMRIGIPGIIAGLSRGMTLERGDIIATGTPAGIAMNSDFGFLADGDRIDMEIEGLGSISNVVRAA